MTQDLYYVESGYLTPDSGYYVYTADAEAAVSSQATMDVTVGVIKDAVSTITCQATVSAVISHIHGADLVAFSNASIATEINVIRATNVALTSVFSAAIDAVRGIYVSAQADSTATISISNQRVRFTEAAVDAAFSLACDATRLAGGTVSEAEATLFNSVTLSASVDKFASTAISVSSEFSQTIQAERFANCDITVASAFTVNADLAVVAQAELSISSTFTSTVDNSRTRSFDTAVTSAFTPTLTVDVFKNSFAVLDSSAALAATADITRSTISALVSFTTVNADVSKAVIADSAVSSQFTVVAVASRQTRNLPATVTQGGNYGGISISSTRSKFGGASVKFDANTQAYDLTNIAFNGTSYVALGYNQVSSTVYFITSSDGINWSRTLTDFSLGQGTYDYDYPTFINYANGTYITRVENRSINGTGSNQTLWYSTNGTTWSSVAWSSASPAYWYSTPQWNSSLGRWVRFREWPNGYGDHYLSTATTLNGTWADQGSAYTRYDAQAVAFKGSATVVVGTLYNSSLVAPRPSIRYSASTNATWTNTTLGTVDNQFYDVASDGTTFVAVGGLGIIYTSTNGTTWTLRTSGTTTALQSISYANGKWFASDGSLILSSSDAVTWTTVATGLEGAPSNVDSHIIYALGQYVASLYATRASTSSDGVTWTAYNNDFDLPNQDASIEYPDSDKWTTWQTVDFWAYIESYTSNRSDAIFAISQGGTQGSWYFGIRNNQATETDGQVRIYINGTQRVTSSPTVAYGQWNHFRLSRSSATYSVYLNGTRVNTYSLTSLTADSNPLTLATFEGTNPDFYIDEVLVTDALLTDPSATSFTVPTAAYTNTADTGLLLHFDTGFDDDASSFPRTQSASASLTSTFTQSTQAVKSAGAFASLSSTSLLSAVAVKNSEIILTAFTNASLTTQAERLRDASSTQASEFAQITVSSRTRAVDSTQASEFTQTAVINKTVNPPIATEAIFTELVAVARTGAGFVQLDAQATMSVTVVKTTDVQSAIDAAATVSATVVRSTDAIASIDSSAALNVDNARIRNSVIACEFSSDLTAVVGKIEQFTIELTAITSLTATSTGTIDFNAALAGQTTLVANNQTFKTSLVSLEATTELTATAGTVKTSAVTTDAIFTELVAVAKTGQGFITLDVVASQSTVVIKTARAQSAITATASLSVTAERTRAVAAVFDSSFKQITGAGKLISGECGTIPFIGLPVPIWFVVSTLTANVDRLRVVYVEANINASATLACQPVKTVDAISLEASSGTLTADLNIIHSGTADLSALAFELAVGQKVKALQANIVSQATMAARIGGTFSARASLQGFAAEVAVVDIIHIDAKLTWMIFADDRDYSISADNRTYSIVEEDRDYLIVQEDRETAVTRELLTTELQGV